MFVQLNRNNGYPIWINPNTVAHVTPHGKNQAKITFIYNTENVSDVYAVVVDHDPVAATELLQGISR